MTSDAGKERSDRLFLQLFDEELSYVWNVLRRLGVRESDREDLAQEVFVRVYKALDTYDATRPSRPWLFAFAFHVASDFRRLARHKAEVGRISDYDLEAASPKPDAALHASQQRALLLRALDTLDLDKRAVIILHVMEELPIPEVARVLGIPEGTASSRLRAGRLELASILRAARTPREKPETSSP